MGHLYFSSNVFLNEQNNDRYQLVYSSQLYGTFFSVYGKFTVSNNTLKAVKLKLINYKGVLNLNLTDFVIADSFKSVEVQDLMKNNKEVTLDCLQIGIKVKAFSEEKNMEQTCNIPLPEESGTHYLEVSRTLIEMDPNHFVFDEEFKWRDGYNNAIDKDLSKFEGYRRHGAKVNTNVSSDEDGGKDPGGLCPKGYQLIHR